LLPCDQITRKSKYSSIVRKVIRKPQIVKQKVKKFTLKKGQKIVWRTFN